jgi:hypothetical protein
MNEDRFKHRCITNDCPFKGQKTSRSCGCHVDERTMMLTYIQELESELDVSNMRLDAWAYQQTEEHEK